MNKDKKKDKQMINKKPMSIVGINVNLGFIFMSLLAEVFVVIDKEVPNDIKIFISCIFLPIIIVCLIILLCDLSLRRKWKKNNLPTINESEETITVEEWNDYERLLNFPGDRTLYSNKINETLGEKHTFIRKTDKYGNVVLKDRNDNMVDWFWGFMFATGINAVSLVALLLDKTNIIIFLVILLIFLPFSIYCIFQMRRIKKLKLEIKFFQFLKLIFILVILIIVFGMLILFAKYFK